MLKHKLKSNPITLTITLFALMLFGCSGEETAPSGMAELELTTPSAVNVGDPFEIELIANLPDDEPAILSLTGSYGIWLFESQFSNGRAVFEIPSEKTTQAGWVTAAAKAGGETLKTHLELVAGPPTEPLTPRVGPKTITADQKSWSLITVIPFDKYANPVKDGTQVTFSIAHPGNVIEEIQQETSYLLAWSRIYARDIAGKTFIAAQSGDAFGKEIIMNQTAGWPIPFSLSNEPERVPADGLRLTQVRSERIVDRFGNVLPDGTLVTFIVEDESGRQRNLPTQTVGGFAIIDVQAPLRPERLKVTATVFAIESEPLFIDFDPGPAVGLFPIVMKEGIEQYQGSMVFTAGPLLGERDQFIPDATPVLFILEHETGVVKEERVLSFDGRAVFSERIENLFDGQYKVSAFVGNGEGVLEFEFKKR
ncbi:MAG: hypothetical protein AAF633_10300 [Chloroflexota bacterium]